MIRAIVCISVLASFAAYGDEVDDQIPAPQIISVAPYDSSDAVDDGRSLLLTFRSVTGLEVSGYRLYRSVQVAVDSNSADLSNLPEGSTVWIPWGRVEAVPGAAITRVVVMDFGRDSAWGVATEAVIEGTPRLSPIVEFSVGIDIPTSIESASWGTMKSMTR